MDLLGKLRGRLAPLRTDLGLNRLLRHSGVLYSAGAVTTLLTFAQQMTTARFLGAESYGRFATVFGSSTLVLLLLDVRTWELANKFLAAPERDAEGRSEKARILTRLGLTDLTIGTLSSLILILLARPIAIHLLKTPDLAWLVRTYALSMPFRIIAQGTLGALVPFYERFRWLAVKSILYALLRLLLISGAAFLGLGLPGVLIALIAAEVLHALSLAVMAWLILRVELAGVRIVDFRRPRRLGEVNRLMGQFWVSATLKGLHFEIFIPVLALMTSPGQVGLFRSGLDVAEVLPKVVRPVTIVLLPAVVRKYEDGTPAEFLRYLRQSALILALLTVPFLIAVVVAGPWLLPVILGEQFTRVGPVAVILAAGFALSNVFAWIRPALVAVDRIHQQNVWSLAAASLSILALLVLAPAHGAVGGAVTLTGFFAVFYPATLIVFWRGFR